MLATLFEQCRELFAQLHLPQNEVCKQCEAKIKAPLLPWHIGADYRDAETKLVVVGKPHRGRPGEELPSGALDAREQATDLYYNSSWAYWSYTREIVEQVHGDAETGWKRIALLNAVKCTSTNSTDRTSFQAAASCLNRLKVLAHELSILKPTTVVFYTWHFHRNLFEKPFLDEDYLGSDEVTSQKHRIPCKNKMIGWWHRTFHTSWCSKLPVLVASHPERKGKQEYISLLAKWIQANSGQGV